MLDAASAAKLNEIVVRMQPPSGGQSFQEAAWPRRSSRAASERSVAHLPSLLINAWTRRLGALFGRAWGLFRATAEAVC